MKCTPIHRLKPVISEMQLLKVIMSDMQITKDDITWKGLHPDKHAKQAS